MMTANVYAEGPGESLDVDPETGRGGEPRRTEDPNTFRVCADQDNMPFSNNKQEGFENKIAELIAKDLGKKLEYQFWVDRFGFIRNTLNAYRCDVIMGTASDVDMMLTSKPYYRSDYVFVYRKDSGLNITNYDSPDLKKAVIGLVGMSPPTRPLSDHDLLGNAKPYRLWRDLDQPPSLLIDDVVKKDIDVAIVWGPIGGYYAKKAPVELVVVPVPEYAQTNVHGKSYWNISVGVRKKDKERMAMIQGALDRRKDDILKILDEYGIPHMPIVDEKNDESENRGDAIPKFY
ncbi:MAG: quinoprotein dehydrogenase-associated putative ABC transporter substrate-binding protein [Methylobacillus sp.]|nr:quinoprotein dehydrogenase-associated putative ABC transporter substrate-binding protein [Methylobacillus sp.]